MTLGLKRGTVKREPHDKQGNEIAVQTIKTLKSILGDDAVDIQHIGSTAISVIKAKPIIDIVWCQNINSTSQNEKFQIHISMVQQRHSKGVADSIDNTVALCPNCHRKMHVVDDPNDVLFLKNKRNSTGKAN